MTNEERILDLLEQHSKMLEQHSELLVRINDRMDRQDTRLDSIENRLLKIELVQESRILPNIQLLAEGQQTLLDTLAPKDRVEALEEEVATLKSIIRILSQDVAELKKAQ